jgi:DNA ligase D-like protein (predicted ligase)
MIPQPSPMLAVSGQPFDSDEYLFEVKWDGVRALAAVEAGRWRLWGREGADYTTRYPELEFLGRLPPGTLLDGELVQFQQGRPELSALLRRHGLTGPQSIQRASHLTPVTYVVFDLLYDHQESLCSRPLHLRRQLLSALVARLQHPRLAFSAGITGAGRQWFAAAVAQGQEGIMAKHLASRYLPGRRSSAWRKIKPTQVIPCVIIGYRPAGTSFSSLLVAAERQGSLAYVAQISNGWTDQMKVQLSAWLARRLSARPPVECPHQATWVAPELYCQVRFLQWTASGRLRGASFAGLISSTMH